MKHARAPLALATLLAAAGIPAYSQNGYSSQNSTATVSRERLTVGDCVSCWIAGHAQHERRQERQGIRSRDV